MGERGVGNSVVLFRKAGRVLFQFYCDCVYGRGVCVVEGGGEAGTDGVSGGYIESRAWSLKWSQ